MSVPFNRGDLTRTLHSTEFHHWPGALAGKGERPATELPRISRACSAIFRQVRRKAFLRGILRLASRLHLPTHWSLVVHRPALNFASQSGVAVEELGPLIITRRIRIKTSFKFGFHLLDKTNKSELAPNYDPSLTSFLHQAIELASKLLQTDT